MVVIKMDASSMRIQEDSQNASANTVFSLLSSKNVAER